MSITHLELPLTDDRPVTDRWATERDAYASQQRHLSLVPAPASVGAPQVRLTRRGRVTVVLAALGVIVALMVVFGSGTAATSEAGTIVDTATVTVQPGQTLWSIAADANPDGDIRDTVDDIVRLNALADGQSLQMGTPLAVPVYGD